MRMYMKKILLILLCLVTAGSLFSCGYTDINLTKEDNVYDIIEDYIKNPDKCANMTVRINAECTVVYNFSENKIARRSIVVRDTDSDMRALYEFRTEDGKYPKAGTSAQIVGKFTDGYIEVEKLKKATYEERAFDIEAVSMTSSALKTFLGNYGEVCNTSEHYQKSIRIYGNISVINKKYVYLNGYDANGSYTWSIELMAKDTSVTLPQENTKYVNAYEIIGTLDMYIEDNIAYPCIMVSEITAVEGILKVEETQNQPQQPIITPGQ